MPPLAKSSTLKEMLTEQRTEMTRGGFDAVSPDDQDVKSKKDTIIRKAVEATAEKFGKTVPDMCKTVFGPVANFYAQKEKAIVQRLAAKTPVAKDTDGMLAGGYIETATTQAIEQTKAEYGITTEQVGAAVASYGACNDNEKI